MKHKPGQQESDRPHDAAFKLGVVLEYLQHPKRKQRICKENEVSEELLEQWHREFFERADRIFADPSAPTPSPRPPEAPIEPTNPEPREEGPKEDPAWGIRITDWPSPIEFPPGRSEPPAWLSRPQRDLWDKRAVVVWNGRTRQLAAFSAESVLGLLDQYRQSDSWRTEGAHIAEQVHRITIPRGVRRKRSRKEGTAEPPTPPDEPAVENEEPKHEDVYKERVSLDPSSAAEFFEFLEGHETRLRKMAEQEKTEQDALLARVYSEILSWGSEAEETDRSEHPLP